jgi:regulator of sigma E protease
MEHLSTLLSVLYVAAAVIFLFGAAVFVHEWGHYFVARKCGMKVEAFAIGFGPKIFSWVKDGIEYSWRWIPAGGFVKLPQMITSEAIEGGNKTGEPLPPASPISRILVAMAGPAMNMVFAFAIATFIYFVGLPMLVNPSVIGYVEPDSAEAKLGIQAGDRVVQVDGQPVHTWQEVLQTTALARTNTLNVVIEHNGERKSYQLEAKASETAGLKLLNLDPQEHPTVMRVRPGMPAEAAGVQRGDIVMKFAGVPIWGTEQFIKLVQSRPDQASEMVVERGPQKQKVTLTITPRVGSVESEPGFFSKLFARFSKKSAPGKTAEPEKKHGFVGIEFHTPSAYEVQKPGPLPWDQVNEVWSRTIGVFSALIHSKQTGVSAKDLSGPIGIFAMLSIQVKVDYRLALSFLVLLNINLAILNMLPLPVLDGGHILMALVEAIFRRPVPVKLQEYATTVFAVLLISFMVFVSYHDILRFGLFKTMFQQETQVKETGEKTAPVPAHTK